MKCLCLVGFGSGPHSFYSALTHMGMAPAKPLPNNLSVDIHEWHRQATEVIKSGTTNVDDQAIRSPMLGRMCERLASEIFLSNAASPLWGWVDDRALDFLDFWQAFDPRISFVLLFARAESVVAELLADKGPVSYSVVQELLSKWHAHSERLLNFGQLHPKRCFMLDMEDALNEPVLAAKYIASKLKIQFECPPTPTPTPTPVSGAWASSINPIARLIAREVLKTFSSASGLDRKISSRLARLASVRNGMEKSGQELINAFHLLSDRSSELARIALIEEQCERIGQLHKRTLAGYQQQYQEFQRREKQLSDELIDLRNELALVLEKNKESRSREAILETSLSDLRQKNTRLDQKNIIIEDRLKVSVDENEVLLLQVHHAQEELADAILRHQQVRAETESRIMELNARILKSQRAQKEIEENNNKLMGELGGLHRENADLMPQMHYAQEELEREIVERQKYECMARTLIADITLIKAELAERNSDLGLKSDELVCINRVRDEQNERILALTNDLKEAIRKCRSLEKKVSQVDAESGVLRADLNRKKQELSALAGELNTARLRVAEMNEQVKVLKLVPLESSQKIAKLSRDVESTVLKLEAMADEKALLLQELQLIADAKAAAERQAADIEKALRLAREDQDFILLQLHQIQEEMVTLHADRNRAISEHASIKNRLSRFLNDNPHYVEFAEIEGRVVSPDTISWRVSELLLCGAEFSTLRFETKIEHGMAGIRIAREDNEEDGFVSKWFGGASHLLLLPIGTMEQVEERSNSLLALTSNEWRRLLGLVRLLLSSLERKHKRLRVAGPFVPEHLVAALKSLLADLEAFPAVPRFDQIQLKREQINHDYEHLWIGLKNFQFGPEVVPLFEFRVSCANVRPKAFGLFPKLEFPRDGAELVFDSWYEESNDDFGGKLELRFALPQSMDLGVWHNLSSKDQSLVRSVIRVLPSWLRLLGCENTLARPVEEWIELTINMRRIIQACTRVNDVQPSHLDHVESTNEPTLPVHTGTSSMDSLLSVINLGGRAGAGARLSRGLGKGGGSGPKPRRR